MQVSYRFFCTSGLLYFVSSLIFDKSTYFYVFVFSQIYRGTGPFSEPETAAVRDFINAQKQNQEFLVMYIVEE